MADSKLLFFDIDGTIWDNKNFIPPSTIEAFDLLKKNGHEIFLNSGRARGYIHHPDLLGIGFDGIISACGTMIEYHGKEVFCRLIDNEELKKDIALVRSYGFKPVLEGKEYLYIEKDEFEGDWYYGKLKKDMKEKLIPIDENEGKWVVNKFSCATTNCDIDACYKELEDRYEFIIHSPEVIEVVPKGFDKATGIEWIANYLGKDISDTFAFGDSINDAGMIKCVGTGVVMGNGSDDVKEMADYVTTRLYDDGIYNACKHFGLI